MLLQLRLVHSLKTLSDSRKPIGYVAFFISGYWGRAILQQTADDGSTAAEFESSLPLVTILFILLPCGLVIFLGFGALRF